MAQETVVEILAKFRADITDFNKKLETVQKELDIVKTKTENTASNVSSSFDIMGNAASRLASKIGAASAIAGSALVAMAVQSFNAAAKVQELDTVMQVVGSTTGVTYKVLKETSDAIRANGIEMASAQEMAIKFAKNELNLADAANIARVAQDLAVISQSNSTETANRLTYAVLNLNTMMLRNAGVQTTVTQAVKAYARENNISAASMTTAQKQQAVLNAILEEGKKINGVYTMSMTNAGKVLRSFARITNDIQVAMGGAFLDALGPIILKFYDLYKAFSLTLREGGALHRIIEGLSAVFMNLVAPLGVALDKAIDFVKNMDRVTTGVGHLGNQIQKYLPVIGGLGAAFATIGGANLLRQVPILGSFLGALNPVMVGLAVLVALSPKLQSAFANLLSSIEPLIPVLLSMGGTLISIANVAIDGFAMAINGLSSGLDWITRQTIDYSTAIEFMASVAIALAIVQTALLIKKTYLLIAAKLKEAAAWVAANAGLVIAIAGIALLIFGFYKAWNSSENFRKAIIKIAQGFILLGETGVLVGSLVFNAFALIVRGSANAQIALGKLKNDKSMQATGKETLNWIDKTNASITGFGDSLIKTRKSLEQYNKPINFSDIASGFKMPKIDIKKIFDGLKADPSSNDIPDGADPSGAASDIIKNMQEVVQRYNDFINYDFAPGFRKDSETARDTIIKSLSMLKNVFDEQAKGLKGDALKNLENAYWEVDKVIRQFIPQAEKIGVDFEKINKAIDLANKEFEKVTQDREEAALEFGRMMRQPFGEPSQITKGLSSAEATVDSIISIYDSLVEQINKRYTEIDESGRDSLINYLTNQTQMLVDLAKKRLIVADKLKVAQKELDSVVEEQKQFAADIKGSLSGFATALADISSADGAAVIQVIKTSSGLVITQMKESSNGVNKITDQLRKRLATIQDFARNIKSLLAQGLNKNYIRQLLEAGPEAAGETAQLLATVGAGQISEINSIYSQIDNVSDIFSRDMADLFYNGAVSSAKAIVDGYQSEYDSIMAKMDAIKLGITEKLTPLTLLGTSIGNDLMQGVIDSLTAKKLELVTLAQSIAKEISDALAAAGAGIGVGLDVLKNPPPIVEDPKTDTSDFNPGGKYNHYSGSASTGGGGGLNAGNYPMVVNIYKSMSDEQAADILANALRTAMGVK